MTHWTAEQVTVIEQNQDLFVSPFRPDGQDLDVTFEAATEADEAVIDSAYEAKYPGSSAVPIMQGSGPRSATVRISRR